MTTTPEEIKQRSEQQKDDDVPGEALKEASEGSEKLASDFKKLIKSLKDGASSGVTGIIGKPQLLEGNAKDNVSPQRIYRSGEIPKIKIGLHRDNSGLAQESPNKPETLKNRFGDPGKSDASATKPEAESKPAPTADTKGMQAVQEAHAVHNEQNTALERPKQNDLTHPDQQRPAENESTAVTGRDANAQGAHDAQAPLHTEQSTVIERPKQTNRTHADQQAPETSEPRASGRGNVVHMRPEVIRVNPDAAYRGEVINRDVPPGTHTVAAGDTVQSVARQHLGADASEDDVAKHARELERVNHLRPNQALREGTELTMPGHTADGGYVTRDAAGRTHTRWADNTERVEGTDGSGHVRRFNAEDGSYTEHHWGRNPQQNYELTKTADGRYLVADRPGETPHEARDANDVRVAHARLNDTMESKITDPAERARFQANMEAFEQRARDRNMPPEEVARTYSQIETLLNHEGNRPTTEAQRRVLAAQVMDQAAHPTTVDQGDHSTCNVTTVESRLYTRNPSEAARLVTEVSTTGRFTARDGTVVRVPPDSIRPDHQAVHHPPPEGERSHASQIFQVTTLNMYYQTEPYTYTDNRGRQHVVPPGGMSYEQHRPRPGHPDDSGERLIDTTRRPPRTIGRSPDITDDGIVRVNNRLTGESTNDVVISHAGDCYGDPTRVTTVQNEEQLNERIAQASRDGKLPIIVRVETDNQPWLRDSGNGSAGGSGGAHVVTITDYQPGPPARVQVDNQWGESTDYQGTRDLSVHDLYMSMRPAADAGQIAELQRDVDWDRAHNTVDTRKEFELLRLRHNLPATDPNRLSDADFDRMMNEQIDAAGERWRQQRANGTFNENEQRNGLRTLGEIIATQPADKQLKLWERTHNAGCTADDRYDRGLSNIIRNNRERWAQEDRDGTANAGERQRARQELDRILNGMTPERRAAILANSRR
ncbi:MAG: hypothetical protein K2X77_02995 [Candidatus Obscuribacterales bacterium]|nr:hypothetical protein [Candidatus Obscuribacterales bacterium]